MVLRAGLVWEDWWTFSSDSPFTVLVERQSMNVNHVCKQHEHLSCKKREKMGKKCTSFAQPTHAPSCGKLT